MSISIYRPYFYIIRHINSGKYYAGVKFAKNANPNHLLRPGGYQTSSNIVKQLITEDGLDSFTIRKIKIFETAEKALDYESRFLRRVNAAFNDKFLNRSNNSTRALSVDYDKRKQTCLEKYGCENPFQSEDIKEKIKQTCLEKFGHEHVSQVPEFKEKIKQTCLRKYGVEYASQSDKIKEKIKQTFLENYGVEHNSQAQEFKEKYKQTCLEKYGCENPLQSEEIKEKIRQTVLEKYGVENPSQSPEIQEKKRQNRNILNNRPMVLLIKKYKEQFNPKLIHCWSYKSQEILNSILEKLKITYGEIT